MVKKLKVDVPKGDVYDPTVQVKKAKSKKVATSKDIVKNIL